MADKFILGFPISEKTASSVLFQNGSDIGIGTDSPHANLDVRALTSQSITNDRQTTTASLVINGSNENMSLQFGVGGSSLNYGNWIQSSFDNGAPGSSPLYLNPIGGNVGIGTTNPLGKLQVTLPAYNNEDTNSQQAIFGVDNGDGLRIGYNETSNKGYINVLKPAVAWGSLVLQSGGGNVGIGTDSPGAKLEITGSTPTAGDTTLHLRLPVGNVTAGTTEMGNILFSSTDASGGGSGSIAKISTIAGIGSSAWAGQGRPTDLAFFTQPLGTTSTLVEAMRIDQDGNVGIGTTNPAQGNLVLSPSTQNADLDGLVLAYNPDGGANRVRARLHIDNFNGYLDLKSSGNILTTRITSAGDSYFNNGNVGIGTNAPGSRVSISLGTGSSLATTFSVANNFLQIGTNDYKTTTNNGVYAIGFGYSSGATNSPAYIGLQQTDTGNSTKGDLVFRTRDSTNDVATTERMRITSAGNVGIGTGTVDPQQLLHINNSSGSFGAECVLRGSLSTGGPKAEVAFKRHTSGDGAGMVLRTSNSSGTIQDVLTLDTSGNVGIGTGTSAPGAKLHVYNPSGGDATTKAEMGSQAVMKLQPHATNSTNMTFAQVDNGSSMGIQVSNGAQTANYDIALNPFGGNVKIGDVAGAKLSISGSVGTTNGAQALPTHTFYSDLDTGMFRAAANTLAFSTEGSEKMRITSAGVFLVNQTTQNSDADGFGVYPAGSSGGTLVNCYNGDDGVALRVGINSINSSNISTLFVVGSTSAGSVSHPTASSTNFNQSSDYRLKEDLQDFNGLDMISDIPVYDFKWKSEESRSYGVMAHELQEVLPQAVTGEKDATEEYEVTPATLDDKGNVSAEAVMGVKDSTQGVDYSKIVPLLVKSIQELKAEIELLKAR